MQALGDKIASTILAQSASVPTLSWSGDTINLSISQSATSHVIPDTVYREACVETAHQALDAANRIGYPVMIKASEGGGGKGIRKVDHKAQLVQCFEQVQQEAPGSPIFIMKLMGRARHLEVQVYQRTFTLD